MESAPRPRLTRTLANDQAQGRALHLSIVAVGALIAEIELTPKPALVDERGSGAHTDLSPELMKRSARSLRENFQLMAMVSFRRAPNQNLREELGSIGRSAERSMLLATKGVNTHRGAIWALGLLVSAAATGTDSPKTIANRAGYLARLPDPSAPAEPSNGSQVVRRYKVAGARGEARAGFPHVILLGLPMLHLSRRHGASETQARLNALLAIMTTLDDTCLLHRGGRTALRAAQRGAAAVLDAGGTCAVRGWKLLQQLDRDLVSLKASPGGSADLLASALFLDLLAHCPLEKVNHGKV